MNKSEVFAKVIYAFLLGLLLVMGCSEMPSNDNLVADNPYLLGKWAGEGRFFDTDLNSEVGLVKIEIEINEDNAVDCKIGEALLINTSIAEAKYGFEIKGELDTKLKKGIELDKKYLIILLVLPEEGRSDVSMSDANFHLKSNYTFDFNMRVGGVKLTKEL